MATRLVDANGNPVTVVAGVDYTATFTLNLDGVLSTDVLAAATITSRIRTKDKGREVLAAKALINIDDGAKTADLVFIPTDSEDWPEETMEADVKVVLAGGTERNHGPYEFPVRRAITV